MACRASILAVVLLAISLCATAAAPSAGIEKIGTPAPSFGLKQWVNSSPIDVDSLRGKVVLVRWWTDTCDLCAATAPALRELQQEFGSKGFTVIGVFHPKPPGDWSTERLRRAVERFQFTFPVALDGDWSALRRWWLDGANREYTSVSFILDKNGIIRYVHPGGEYHEANGSPEHAMCERDFKQIRSTIQELFAE
jgi:peroxiredoxin